MERVENMKEIKCPKCGEVFAVDESEYAQIVQQVRDKEFDKELKQREKDLEEIEEIDKTISHLQKTKEALLSSENQLRLANNKAEDLSIKKLTKDAPTVKKMFDEVNSGRGE